MMMVVLSFSLSMAWGAIKMRSVIFMVLQSHLRWDLEEVTDYRQILGPVKRREAEIESPILEKQTFRFRLAP